MLRDVGKSETQKRAEAEVTGFKEALGPFVTAAEVTRMPMVLTGAKPSNHPIIFVNQAFLDLTRFEEHEVMGQRFDALMEQGTDPEMLVELRTAFAGGRDLRSIVRYLRKDNKPLWVTIYIAPVRNSNGDIVQYFASFVDVTTQKAEEKRLIEIIQDLNNQVTELTQTISSGKSGHLIDNTKKPP